MANFRRLIKIESGCNGCFEEISLGMITEEDALKNFKGTETVVGEAKILIDYTCKKHGGDYIFAHAHFSHD